MPIDLGIDCYREHLVELERVVSECETLGSVVILGDFNAQWMAEIFRE